MVTPRRPPRAESLQPPTLEVLHFSRPDWQADALCAEPDYSVDMFFDGRGGAPAAAIAVCARCAVKVECLEYAMADDSLVGIWGATTEADRRRMRGAS